METKNTAKLKSNQVDLLEKLRLFKEQKQAKAREASKQQDPKWRGAINVEHKTLTGRVSSVSHTNRNVARKALAAKQPPQARSTVAVSRSSYVKSSAVRSIKVQSCPTGSNNKSKPNKAAPIKRLSFSKFVVESPNASVNVTPKRKRTSSFTIDEHEASPAIKRPVISADNVELRSMDASCLSDENQHPECETKLAPAQAETAPAQARTAPAQAETAPVQEKPATVQAKPTTIRAKSVTMQKKPIKSKLAPMTSKQTLVHSKRTSVPSKQAPVLSKQARVQTKPIPAKRTPVQNVGSKDDQKLSMRDRLALWKQQKTGGTTSSSARLECEIKASTAFTRRVSTLQKSDSAKSTVSGPKPKPAAGWDNRTVTQESDIHRRKSHAGHLSTKDKLSDNAFQRRKSYACQLHNVQTKLGDQKQTKSARPVNAVIETSKPDPHMRRKSCNFPVQQKSKPSVQDNVLNRRKSYALSLKEQVQAKSAAGAPGRKRRITVAGVCLAKAVSTPTKTLRQSPRVMQNSVKSPPGVEENIVKSPAVVKQNIVKSSPLVEQKISEPLIQSPVKEVKTDAGVKSDNEDVAVPLEIPSPTSKTPEVLPTKTPKSCRKSMSVRFTTPHTPSPEKSSPCTRSSRRISSPVVKCTTPARITPLSKEHSMKEKLNNWLESRGRTPSRFSHMLKFGENLSGGGSAKKVKGGLSLHELSNQQSELSLEDSVTWRDNSHIEDPLTQKLDAILSECLILLQFDCPTDTVEQWLTQICSNLEGVQQVAKYWVCKAKIAQQSGDDNAVISIFEESVRHNAQPPEEVAEALKEFVDHMSQKKSKRQSLNSSLAQALPCTPQHKARDVQEENMFTSSAIKYCYTETTPFFSRLRSKARRSHTTPYAVVTPVRRSTRRSVTTLPSMLQDHDMIVESLNHLSLDKKDQALFMPNRALHDISDMKSQV